MDEFKLWFSTGLQHILDIKAYDHILYIVCLSLLFRLTDWKKLLILVTAFTLGHSLTLALSVFDLVAIPSSWIEIAIALTIAVTCLINFRELALNQASIQARYWTALLFGCIHGLGFSFLLKAMLGKEESVLFPLFSFNLGLEIGQIAVLVLVQAVTFFIHQFAIQFEKIILSTITFVILLVSIYLILERI
ncbi:MAG: HupE/UreJ family protein [Saprospiraceae bacterium]|nr:HupE/UreJ family protein [Saprospiraceae bacterium]